MPEALNSSLLEEADLKTYCFPNSNVSCVKASYNIATKTVLYFVLVFAMTITILGNSVVIISIAHFKQLHTPTNILVMSLALVDLLLGITVMPFSMTRSVDGCWYYGEELCFLHSSFDMFLTTASIFHLISIATDRYEAVCYPLQYPTRVTIPVAWLMVAISWTAAAVYSYGLLCSKANLENLEEYIASISCLGYCGLLFNALWAALDACICFFVPCSVMFCLYAQIFFISKKHTRKIEGVKQGRNDVNLTKFSQRVKHENKAAKTLGIVVGAFISCWMPFFVTSLLDPYINFATPVVLFDVFVWLGYINSTLNPIIYGLFYPWFRKTLYLIVTLKIFAPHSSDIKVYAA
ncbi:trace amine-associated receptor 13c-like [Pangasianodon hypophthalmus]|uniref:trace amine-associated receptor 13c-like n=1 Tax=Pangasianodon hypophthalmus TaxID=310915 RepID=UPI000EFF3C94|nr:trace amine-associated receptor 13c-like [Pangasianodon hypophthalmus]